MDALPVSLERLGQAGLRIHWSDGRQLDYSAAQLRKSCPCATCREKHGPSAQTPKNSSGAASLPVLSLAEAKPLAIQGMRPVGNYAYNIAFSDGHDSGIFTFEYLIELGQPASA
ncbi:MAG: DUF971 domain-containing protein [bacterium]|nr:DUF971 domain-containing protein [bacterium]